MTTTNSSRRVQVSPVLIQAAKLRKTINDRRGVSTSPVTVKIAALEATNADGHPVVKVNGLSRRNKPRRRVAGEEAATQDPRSGGGSGVRLEGFEPPTF